MRIILIATLVVLSSCSGHGPIHWDGNNLMCDKSGLKVAEIMREPDGTWSAWGGNGAGYGMYQTEDEAKHSGESIVSNGWSWRIGGKWLACPE